MTTTDAEMIRATLTDMLAQVFDVLDIAAKALLRTANHYSCGVSEAALIKVNEALAHRDAVMAEAERLQQQLAAFTSEPGEDVIEAVAREIQMQQMGLHGSMISPELGLKFAKAALRAYQNHVMEVK